MNLFAGKFRKTTSCIKCNQVQKTSLQKLTALHLEESDFIGYEFENESFLTRETFRCGCHFPDQRSVLTIEKSPDIIVIVIHQGNLNRSKAIKALPKIKLKDQGMKDFLINLIKIIEENYDYCGGIFTQRKLTGEHSIAIIQCGGNKERYYKFTEESVKSIKLDESPDCHPKLLFYCKSQ